MVVWNDRYLMGIDFIDKEHKLLLSTMDKLLKVIEDGQKTEWACREGVKYLKHHSIEHFKHEEEYMKSIEYSEYEIHKHLHDEFRDKTLPALEMEMEASDYSTESVRHFLGVCIGWVVSHTLTEDLAIVGKRSSKWSDIPHNNEKEAMEQTIIQLTQDMFQLKAKLISGQYSGEDFGKVVCSRLVYRGQNKDKWEIFLVFEEQLLLKIVGRILNTEYPRVDDMVINVSRYIFRQFLERIRESFPMMDLFELEKESLLTQEQLVSTFEDNQPSCSLLFDAGEGYFAFSAISEDSIQGKLSPTIDYNNTMDAVKQYLIDEDTSWKEQKKKVLVVDDSEFLRNMIVRLLEDKYKVLEAGSTISAIQSITVNKPDLVLLDYEMPVCDGRQTLEMLRSEKSTAGIPVIFLTGKGDTESVKKVISLKPEGYLLKTMPEDEIRKAVDDFFVRNTQKS